MRQINESPRFRRAEHDRGLFFQHTLSFCTGLKKADMHVEAKTVVKW